MHLLATDSVSLDDTAIALDLEQSAADIVFLSFTDSDLAVLASAWQQGAFPSLRLASLAQLQHPWSVDRYLDKTIRHARFVLVRLLGGMDYWRYGIDELAASARKNDFHLACVPGDHMEDARLDAASTVPHADLRLLWDYFQQGGPDNMAACLSFIASKIGGAGAAVPPRRVEAFGLFDAARREQPLGAPCAKIVFYRSVFLAGDAAPIVALADGLAQRGFAVEAAYVTSLKDPGAIAPLAAWLAAQKPDVILNATAFSARLEAGAGVLDSANVPVLQVILAGSSANQWAGSQRGLSASDLAMQIGRASCRERVLWYV